MSFDEVVEKGERFVDEMKSAFVLESLENLRKNGKLKKLQAIVAIALRIKLLCEASRGRNRHGGAKLIREARFEQVDCAG